MGSDRLHDLTASSARWLMALLATLIVSHFVSLAAGAAWLKLRVWLGVLPAVLLIAVLLIAAAVSLASRFGALHLPHSKPVLTVSYVFAMARYWLRDLLGARRVGSGRANPRFVSLAEFEAADPRRVGDRDHPQLDFGKWWLHDRSPLRCRITWIETTGELISLARAAGEEEEVEVIATIDHESEVERRLRDWAHAGFGRGPLRWVRYRAAGWDVPLPPRGRWWYLQDQEPQKPWPAPPAPSLERSEGVYLGAQIEHHGSVQIVEPAREPRPLYHYVDSSPTGFAWGYGGAGPTDLARSILADRLGYAPATTISVSFREDVVANLTAEFTITFGEVDGWIDAHGELFAAHPRAEPFDPFAAGGAYQ